MFQKFAVFCAALTLLMASASASSTRLIAPVPTPYVTLAPHADPDRFSFIVGGDNRSTGHGYPMPPALAQICREIGLIHPPFVFWTGDVIEGYGDTPAEANAEYDTFLESAALCGVPLFNSPGNHEFSLDSRLLPIYEKRMGRLYGSFDYGHSHFIALNTTAVMPDGTLKSGTLDDAQWAWLTADLDANKTTANTFVFLHHFVFGPPDDDPTFDSGWADRVDRDRF
ncbi:MAG: metallophosphoesterase, partial [Armatimonadota bacterium]|nr:metallophosphoesterase [Armatimonadota bacterium]